MLCYVFVISDLHYSWISLAHRLHDCLCTGVSLSRHKKLVISSSPVYVCLWWCVLGSDSDQKMPIQVTFPLSVRNAQSNFKKKGESDEDLLLHKSCSLLVYSGERLLLFYSRPNILNRVGVKMAVKIPFSVSARLANAPYFRLTSMAAEVPTAWAAAPSESPCAMGL